MQMKGWRAAQQLGALAVLRGGAGFYSQHPRQLISIYSSSSRTRTPSSAHLASGTYMKHTCSYI